ncbi:hypothetical protein K503DRAFT_472077 [Rhizopogon vinicolor AM-OR11-026]|uniref:Uncharacterized protein n=1 Tax=Rhizopogon vinicolor AM-OR11-026 TaxID=1314800 RepID=A0A1B7N9U7_9AGAM|nr:hypothetical protein K503DRAFT_472077 [Rhizopogon vinicolor AM-OR11-026]
MLEFRGCANNEQRNVIGREPFANAQRFSSRRYNYICVNNSYLIVECKINITCEMRRTSTTPELFRYNIPAALNAVPRRIPCLTFNKAQLRHSSYFGTQVGAEKVILRSSVSALVWNLIDGNCKTIAFHNCDFHDLDNITRLPSSNKLEFDGCSGSGYEQEGSTELSLVPANLTWDGDTVTVINSEFHCIEALLVLLRADRSYSLWPRVSTLNLVVQGDFVMKFPLETLKAMINNRREAVVQEDLGMVDKELDK